MKSELCQIPGVGPKMASYLEQQGNQIGRAHV